MLEFENKIHELAQRLGEQGFHVMVNYISVDSTTTERGDVVTTVQIELTKNSELALYEVTRLYGGHVSYQRVI